MLNAVPAIEARRKQALRFKRNGRDLRHGIDGLRLCHTGLVRHHQQGYINGIAVRDPAVIAMREKTLVGQHRGLAQPAKQALLIRQRGTSRCEDTAFRIQAAAGDFPRLLTGKDDPARRQLVDRQGAGLVGGDKGAGTKRLYRQQLPHNDMPPRHAPHTDGQRDRQRDRQALRNRRHGQRHGKQEYFLQRHAATQCHDRHQQGDHRDQQGDAACKAFHPHQQGRLGGRPAKYDGGNATKFRVQCRARDDSAATATADERTGKGHVETIAKRALQRMQLLCTLEHRHGFTGQQGLIHFEVMAGKQAHVGRNALTGFQQHDVPGYQLLCIAFMGVALAQHPAAHADQLLQGHRGTLGRVFLGSADNGIQQQHRADEDSVRPFTNCQ